MSKRIKFKLNQAGIIELFTSAPVQGWLQEVGDELAATATGMSHIKGSEYGARAHDAGRTAICNVYPANKEGALDNVKNNTLLKAKGASGLPSKKQRIK